MCRRRQGETCSSVRTNGPALPSSGNAARVTKLIGRAFAAQALPRGCPKLIVSPDGPLLTFTETNRFAPCLVGIDEGQKSQAFKRINKPCWAWRTTFSGAAIPRRRIGCLCDRSSGQSNQVGIGLDIAARRSNDPLPWAIAWFGRTPSVIEGSLQTSTANSFQTMNGNGVLANTPTTAAPTEIGPTRYRPCYSFTGQLTQFPK